MAPYFCYTHQGLYVASPLLEGCQDPQCIAFAMIEVRPAGVRLVGSGGSTTTKQSRVNSNQFHRDMYAYKDAVEQGVQPEMVTAVASEQALKEAEAT